MKRLRLIGTVLLLGLLCALVWADGSWNPTSPTIAKVENRAWLGAFNNVSMITCISTFTSGTTNVPELTVPSTLLKPMRLFGVEFLSGTTVPTNGATVVITDDYGMTLIPSTTWSTKGYWLARPLPVLGNLTVTISGNSVAGAVGTVRLVVAP
jgi:hypothetical protein